MGVDYTLFWKLNPKKLEPFIEAFSQKIKLTREQNNFTSWLNGVYITYAIAACFGKNSQYPDKPVSLEAENPQDKNKVSAQKFEAFAIGFNSEFKKKNESSDNINASAV